MDKTLFFSFIYFHLQVVVRRPTLGLSNDSLTLASDNGGGQTSSGTL